MRIFQEEVESLSVMAGLVRGLAIEAHQALHDPCVSERELARISRRAAQIERQLPGRSSRELRRWLTRLRDRLDSVRV